jgi:cytochrome c oxidase cbb3-type subunit III
VRRRTARFACCAVLIALAGCERETRRFSEPPATAVTPDSTHVSALQAGGQTATREASGPYDQNAYAVAQGKRWFTWFNCVGCHAHGGGGSGPALMDDKWIYGHQPHAIFETIVEGRPNGMPAFRGRLTEQQVWQLVAYVRSMSGLIRHDAIPGRSDALQAVEPELRRDELTPKSSSVPPPQ